jgi:glycosyltransferase involved in cell wall biosynthesis
MYIDRTFPYRVVDTDPLIVVTFWHRASWAVVEDIRARFPESDKLYFLCQLWWQHESGEHVESAGATYDRLVKAHPNVEGTILCNTCKEVEVLSSRGLCCIHCNHNAFVDETIFTVLPGKCKNYDAIYSARLHSSKRHYLASKIGRIALITYGYDDGQWRYLKEIRRLFPETAFLNYYSNGARAPYEWLSAEKVANALNEAHVGLCLSSEEGASYASIEYLLCGLPVVSTRSIGGREVFFDGECARIVDDTPEAVLCGVEELIQTDISAVSVRERTLERIKPHRERFCNLIQAIYRREGIARDAHSIWDGLFVDKLGLRWIGPDSAPHGTLFAPVLDSHLAEPG